MTRLSPSQDGLESLNPTTYALRFFSQPHVVIPLLTARELWASPQSVSFTTRLKRRGDEKDAGEIPGREPPNGGIINAIWRKRRERLADSSTTEGKRAIIRRA